MRPWSTSVTCPGGASSCGIARNVSSIAASMSSSGVTTKRTERPVSAVATSRATWSNGSGVAIVTTPFAYDTGSIRW